MPAESARRPFEVRHLQLARAVFAAIAAVMITFSPDHSASVGLAVFSGWAIATGLVELLAGWLVYRPGVRGDAGTRWPAVVLGVVTILAGMVAGVVGLRSTLLYFVVVIAWALVAGACELAVAGRAAAVARGAGLRVAQEQRDGIVVGVLTLALGVALALVPMGYQLDYVIPAAGRSFTLTGIAIAVGVFGGYAAIVAVYLGIAGLSPRRRAGDETDAEASVTPASATMTAAAPASLAPASPAPAASVASASDGEGRA